MEPGQAALYREVLEESRRKVYESHREGGLQAQPRVHPRGADAAAAGVLRSAPAQAAARHAAAAVAPSWSASASWSTTWSPKATARSSSASSPRCWSCSSSQADKKRLQVHVPGRPHQGPHGARWTTFNAPDGPPLFFICLKAGGTGLNLTAADYVIHYDPWWNPAVEDQATDRTHRIGQTARSSATSSSPAARWRRRSSRSSSASGSWRRACSAPTRTSARR